VESRTPQAIAEAYFEAWCAKDFGAVRRLLHDDLSFQGPYDRFNSASDFINAITQLGGLIKILEKRNVLVNGQDVCTIYDLVPVNDATNVTMAELYHVADDKITSIRLIFDTVTFSEIF
jgi:ketosteroid isomerase-like protein